MVGSPTSGGQLWCFGGEFASTKQTNFHHYRDVRLPALTSALGLFDRGTSMGKGGNEGAPKCPQWSSDGHVEAFSRSLWWLR